MITRRLFAIAATTMLLSGVAHANEVALIAPDEVHQRASEGTITLIDIRQPEEWAQTGTAAGAEKIALRDPELGAKLEALTGGDRNTPVALICATGSRSGYLAGLMQNAGFSAVYSVSEGMMGSKAGPGWLRRGLPLAGQSTPKLVDPSKL